MSNRPADTDVASVVAVPFDEAPIVNAVGAWTVVQVPMGAPFPDGTPCLVRHAAVFDDHGRRFERIRTWKSPVLAAGKNADLIVADFVLYPERWQERTDATLAISARHVLAAVAALAIVVGVYRAIGRYRR